MHNLNTFSYYFLKKTLIHLKKIIYNFGQLNFHYGIWFHEITINGIAGIYVDDQLLDEPYIEEEEDMEEEEPFNVENDQQQQEFSPL